MTGQDDKLLSVLVLAQDGRTAPLRTLFHDFRRGVPAVDLTFFSFFSLPHRALNILSYIAYRAHAI